MEFAPSGPQAFCVAAEDVAAFENDNLLPCFGEVIGVYQAVVTAADDDSAVVLLHSM
jgi:hypothetical protein